MSPLLLTRSQVGPPFQAAKWQKYALLIEIDEMKELFSYLEEFWIVKVAGLISLDQAVISQEEFLEGYSSYLHSLKGEGLFSEKDWRPLFSSIWTVDLEAVYSVPLDEKKGLVKIERPVMQLQRHRFDYSVADASFRFQVFGEKSIDWGIQLSYPSLYQDQECQILKVRDNPTFPNTAFFKRFQQWVRLHTIPTSFEREDKRVTLPIRLGKKCLSWINTYPALIERGLIVRS